MKKVLYQHNFDDLDDTNKQTYWLLPQLLAFLGNNLELGKLDGKYSFRVSLQTIKQQLDHGRLVLDNGRVLGVQDMKQMLGYLTQHPRGKVLCLIKQSSALGSRYAANVPLLLSAFKEYRNIGYNQWHWDEPERQYFLDKDLLELSEHFYKPIKWTKEELLEYQEIGRTVKSGDNSGKIKSIGACTSITGIPDQDFNRLGRLHKLLLCQCWVYSPDRAHKLAITNLQDLDQPAEPLVSTEIFNEQQPQKLCEWL